MENKILTNLKSLVKRKCQINELDKKECENISGKICAQYLSDNYNFSDKLRFKKVTKWGKKRLVAHFDDKFSIETFLSKYIETIIKKEINIKSKSSHELVEDFLTAINKVGLSNNFCMVKFDFKDFYNSLCSEYVYKKFLKTLKFEKTDETLIKTYIGAIPYCFAGLNPSNVLAEIILEKFKSRLIENFKKLNLINCIRYSDDFILIFDEKVNKLIINKNIQQTINEIFFDRSMQCKFKNKVKAHLLDDKYTYLTEIDLPYEFDFLGYNVAIFKTNNILDYSIGLSKLFEKLFYEKLKTLIEENHHDGEKLRKLIKLVTRRFSYHKFSLTDKHKIVTSSYTQNKKVLRNHRDKIDEKYLNYYKNIVVEIFENLNLPVPYYLKDNNELSGYSLYANLLKNRTVLLSRKNVKKLNKLLNNNNFENINYKELENNIINLLICR